MQRSTCAEAGFRRAVELNPRDVRANLARAILRKLGKKNYRVLVLSAAGMHTHFLVELPDDVRLVRKIIGECKTAASHAIRASDRMGRSLLTGLRRAGHGARHFASDTTSSIIGQRGHDVPPPPRVTAS